MSAEDGRTVWVGNLDDRVTEEILFELFLQAGPLSYVKRPKDKATGQLKNFAFVCYRNDCSVPYAITLINEIKLFGKNLRVQSRHLQELQAKGLASYDHGGVHSIEQVTEESPKEPNHEYLGDGLLVAPKNQPSLMGQYHPNIPPHVLQLAQQQMAMLNSNQPPIPLHLNPSLNARMMPRDDRHGSANYNRNYHDNNRNHSNADNLNYQNSGSRNYQNSGGYSGHGYNNRHNSNDRSRGPRHIDNHSMQAMKARSEDSVAHNSQMLASLQERQGRFDMGRLGNRGDSYSDNRYNNQSRDNRYQDRDNRYQDRDNRYQDRDNRYQDRDNRYQDRDSRYQDRDSHHHRLSNRDHRQQPYDRHDSQRGRNHDRHSSHDRYNDRNQRGGHRSNSYDRNDRGSSSSYYNRH